MEEYYIKSLRMINKLKIKSKKEYNKLLEYYLILNIESLEYMAQTRSFKRIIEIAKEV